MSSLASTVREKSSCIKMSSKSASLKILEFDEKSNPFIFQESLNSIFNHDEVKNRKIGLKSCGKWLRCEKSVLRFISHISLCYYHTSCRLSLVIHLR